MNYRKHGFIGLLLGLAVVCLLSSVRADTPPAYRERDVWSQPISTSADVFTASLTPLTRGTQSTPSCSSTTYRFTVGIADVATATILYLRVKNVATGAFSNFSLNGGVTLSPGQLYSFAFNGSAGFEYNFRVGTTTTIGILTMDRSEGAN